VVAVKDGDTIGVLYGGRAETVRLHGIDAPEMGQPFGGAAKQAASLSPSARSPASASPIGTARISTRSPRRSAFSTAVQDGRTVLDGHDDEAADEMSATLVRSPHNCSPSDSSSHLPSDLPLSDSGLGDALKSKRSQRAQDGDREAQRVATGIDWSDVGREAERIDNEERPRRKQANIDLPEDLKREFKAAVQQDGKQMRFVVEDLIRLYLDRAT
jgi:hypothetical protein